MLEKREDLFIGQFPGCLVFADRTEQENGDYKDVARVTRAGNIKYMTVPSTLPDWVHKIIEEQAKQRKTEWRKCVDLEIACRPMYFYEKMLGELPESEFVEWIKRKRTGMPVQECCIELLPIYEKYC